MQPKITKTFLRTEEMMTKYIARGNALRQGEKFNNPFENWQDCLVKEFEHWVIIENEFPYDAVATTSHMISTKRMVTFDWKLLNAEEIVELQKIKEGYIKDNYDVLWENLPRGSTFPAHFHLHLMVLKRE